VSENLLPMASPPLPFLPFPPWVSAFISPLPLKVDLVLMAPVALPPPLMAVQDDADFCFGVCVGSDSTTIIEPPMPFSAPLPPWVLTSSILTSMEVASVKAASMSSPPMPFLPLPPWVLALFILAGDLRFCFSSIVRTSRESVATIRITSQNDEDLHIQIGRV
jgi:hypothetical protein